ncbi:MAG: acyl-CoA dehydrogenase family protein [candidate division WOR-3 bacterium]|nr:acyl-CoA dehydrogenase family protein [candidate division WOR-3 bacterium]MCX7837142.1 acyl-CoA dehydrogenase family protein [candidate division WOR-3 bacterium]MDW8114340.1 acyl-CoA dehydrogenase family protein [candidate division WOR-3 bacterium]
MLKINDYKKYLEFQEEVKENLKNLKELDEYSPSLLKENLNLLKEKGYLGVPYPKEYGGLGLDYLHYAIVICEISKICPSTGLAVAAHTSLCAFPIFKYGDEEQKKRYLIPLARGEKIGAMGLTEPNAGSEASAIELQAKKNGNFYILNGTKRFITNSKEAEIFVILSTLDKSLGKKGITAFIIERNFKGFTIGREEDKLGVRGSSTCELIFEDCEVPKENLLGKEGEGYKYIMETLDGGRISIAAFSLGIAKRAYEMILKWEKERETKSEIVYKIIAECDTLIESATLLTYYSALLKNQGERGDKESANAKLYTSEVAIKVCDYALSLYSYYGISKEYNLEKFFRDAKICEIGEGTSEIMKLIIAKEALKNFK